MSKAILRQLGKSSSGQTVNPSSDQLDKAINEAEACTAEAVDLLLKLLAIDTSNPPARNYEPLVDLLAVEYGKLDMTTERVTVPVSFIEQTPYSLEGPRPNLLAHRSNGASSPLSIYAHMDTVPYDAESWQYDPLGEVAVGCVFGRGASDLKGPIAGLLTALKIIYDVELSLAYDITCLMCTDEELLGGYPGIQYLAEQGYVKPPILSMEGSSQPIVDMGYMGALDVTVTVIGCSTHSGRSYAGVNAVEAMIPILDELLALKREVEARESSYPAEPDAPWHLRHPVLNLDVLQGGFRANVVPDQCVLVINRRYIPEEDIRDVETEIEDAIRRGQQHSPALHVQIEFTRGYPPMTIDMNSVHQKRMLRARMLAHGYEADEFITYLSYGSSDMATVQQILGTDQFIVAGVGGRPDSRGHGVDENVTIPDLTAFIKQLIYFLTDNAILQDYAP